MFGQSGIHNDEAVLLIGFCIRNTFKDSGKWIGQKKGGDKLHCDKLATVIVRTQDMPDSSRSSTEAPVAELAYWNAVLGLVYNM